MRRVRRFRALVLCVATSSTVAAAQPADNAPQKIPFKPAAATRATSPAQERDPQDQQPAPQQPQQPQQQAPAPAPAPTPAFDAASLAAEAEAKYREAEYAAKLTDLRVREARLHAAYIEARHGKDHDDTKQAMHVLTLAEQASAAAWKAIDTIGAPPKAKPEDVDKADADLARLKAITTLPQLTTLRGGTLGIPSSGVISGLQATIDARLLGDQERTDVFAQLGGIQIRERSSVDVFAEVLAQDVPRFLIDNDRVTKSMIVTQISAAGIRGRFRTRGVQWIMKLDDPSCARALALPVTSDGAQTRVSALSGGAEVTDAKAKEACNVGTIDGMAFTTFTFGARVLRRASAEDEGKDSIGGAFEAMLQYERPGFMLHGGFSGWRLAGADDANGVSKAVFPRLSVLRITGGMEHRGSKKTDGTDIVPRVGFYGAMSHAWWNDQFTFGSIYPRIQSTETELGVYAGGKFSDKFSGLVAFRWVKPFGRQEEELFVVSFQPSISAGGVL